MNQMATAFDHAREREKAAAKAAGGISIMGVVLDIVGKWIAAYLQ